MARTARISDNELLRRLTRVFREVGYSGASLSILSEATGLKKASLYHRFPGGKEQMAREVLDAASAWLERYVLAPLEGRLPPAERIEAMIAKLDDFYAGGKEACLLNLLASGTGNGGLFAEKVREALEQWIAALTVTLRDAGFGPTESEARARRAVVLIEGSLVVARGLRTPDPFKECLASLKHELLDKSATPKRPIEKQV